jgi:hypothetical protein
MSVELKDLLFGMKQIVDPKFLTDDQYHQHYTTIMTSQALNKNCGISIWIWCYNSDEPNHRWLYPNKENQQGKGGRQQKMQTIGNPRSWLPWNPYAHPFTSVSKVRPTVARERTCRTSWMTSMKKNNKSQVLYNHLMFFFAICIIGQLKSHDKHQVIETNTTTW